MNRVPDVFGMPVAVDTAVEVLEVVVVALVVVVVVAFVVVVVLLDFVLVVAAVPGFD